jgi:hypothetical protein
MTLRGVSRVICGFIVVGCLTIGAALIKSPMASASSAHPLSSWLHSHASTINHILSDYTALVGTVASDTVGELHEQCDKIAKDVSVLQRSTPIPDQTLAKSMKKALSKLADARQKCHSSSTSVLQQAGAEFDQGILKFITTVGDFKGKGVSISPVRAALLTLSKAKSPTSASTTTTTTNPTAALANWWTAVGTPLVTAISNDDTGEATPGISESTLRADCVQYAADVHTAQGASPIPAADLQAEWAKGLSELALGESQCLSGIDDGSALGASNSSTNVLSGIRDISTAISGLKARAGIS